MPAQTLAIQMWIHWQALVVFIKGMWLVSLFEIPCLAASIFPPLTTTFLCVECTDIPYISHPDKVDTAASKIIGTIMTPAFWIRDKIHTRGNQRTK